MKKWGEIIEFVVCVVGNEWWSSSMWIGSIYDIELHVTHPGISSIKAYILPSHSFFILPSSYTSYFFLSFFGYYHSILSQLN